MSDAAKIDAYVNELSKDPAKLKTFLRKVMGPPRRSIVGQEYADIMLLLKLVEPFETSNNQHTWTDMFLLGGKTYCVTVFPGNDPPELVEIEDDIQQD